MTLCKYWVENIIDIDQMFFPFITTRDASNNIIQQSINQQPAR